MGSVTCLAESFRRARSSVRAYRLAPILVVLLVACGGGPAVGPPVATVAPDDAATLAAAPRSTEGSGPVVPRAGTFSVLFESRRVRVYSEPDRSSSTVRFGDRNPFGQPVPLLVEDWRRDERGQGWIRVSLPVRPNGTDGWIREDDARIVRQRERIEVDLSARTLTRYRENRLLDRFRVGIGNPTTPTSVGTHYVWAHVPQPSPAGPYGTYLLGLSAWSPFVTDPEGARLAIHGTSDPSDIGARVSQGCIRVFNEDMRDLRDVPMGTPVEIHP